MSDKSKFWIKPMALAVSLGLSLPTLAEEESEDKKAKEDVRVVIVGTRAAPRSIGDSPVPVDVISGAEFESQGITDMNSMLAVSVPSFNVNAQPISDAATLVRPANLRGLSPDSTLILVNGKRRHRASVIAFLGGGISDGSQGPDISTIPSVALKQIEVLRDGAAAQYGSDAVAGVMNFVLNDSASGGYAEVQTGQFYEGDGTSSQFAFNKGLPLGERGFLNVSLEYREADPTSRSVQRTDAANLITAGNTNVADPAQIWGSPEIKDDTKFFFNSGVDLSNTSQLYAFGNWAEREVEGGFFFRNPLTRGGVFSNDGGESLLVGNLDPDNNTCDTVLIDNDPNSPTYLQPDPLALAAVEANPNCFTHYSNFPGGFTPNFGGVVADQSFAFGFKGEYANGVSYDYSYTYGKNKADFFIRNTINSANLASVGDDPQTSFDPGAYTQEETGLNAAFTIPLDNGYVSLGFEHRTEEFTITAGEANSYEFNPDLAAQGFGIGSNGFPGFKETDAGSNERKNWAAYVDFEVDLSPDVIMTAAARHEEYDDFGATTNFKLSTRWQTTDALAFRGAVSTGFRAPTVGQANVRNVTTAFENGQLSDQATLPPTNPISQLKGGELLQPETARNMSLGFVFEHEGLFMTVDYYRIKMEDRITLSSSQLLTNDDIQTLLNLGISDAQSFTSVRYFTNDFDTTTRGVDLVANYSMEMWGGNVNWGFVYNWTDTEVDRFDPNNIGATRVRQIEENLPDVRATLSMNYTVDDWRTTVRYNHYSGFYEAHLDDGTLPIEVERNGLLDVEIGYDVSDNFNLAVGAQNILDEYPTDNPYATIVGAQYPVTSPYGFNGGYYYVKAGYRF